ncbi:FG-GAP repeat protein [Candidatus Uhrbacteria bacterium]|nr:FG-GAP repeat protein [Candidatus Uhrbacteria bacterium]
MLTILPMLLGCEALSPFVGEELKRSVCDRDQDGLARASEYCGGEDCDDSDAAVGVPTAWYRDVDLDTFGAGQEEFSCSQPVGFVPVSGDCDDTDEKVSPTGIETCNQIDDDCDQEIDEENIPTWYQDADLDTYGDPLVSLTQCEEPDGYVDNALDCDDTTDAVSPADTEICDDGIDQDCNGLVDDAEGASAWYADQDMDGYGDVNALRYSCEASVEGYVTDASDCDDTDLDVNPSANEACGDGVDQDCDGEVDTDAVDVPWYRDADEDGYGDASATVTDCAPPEGYVGNAQDCDDAAEAVHPHVEEICEDGIDNNCDGSPNGCELSGDVSLAEAETILRGQTSMDEAGWSVAGAGDVNGDGIDDLVVGAPGSDRNASNSGSAYVLFGPLDTSAYDIGMANAVLTGEARYGEAAGWSVAGAGDVNGDGVDDLVVGAMGYDTQETTGINAGAAYVQFGPLVESYEVSLVEADVKMTGLTDYDQAGWSVAGAGDVNGDGIDDLVVGSPGDDTAEANAGAAYILFGPLTEGETSLAEADAKLTGEAVNDFAGWRVAGAGDVNGDGTDDLVVGAQYNDASGANAGATYVLLGPLSQGQTHLAEANTKLTGEAEEDYSGWSVAGARDVNEDGVDDLVVGAPYNDAGGSQAGRAYVLFGPLTEGEMSLADADVKLTGEAEEDYAGWSVASARDVNNDGTFDLIVGAPYNDAIGSNAGASYILYGPLSEGDASLADADVKLTGETEGDLAGISVAASDLNNDGYSDVVTGANRHEYELEEGVEAEDAGSVYILNGTGK